MDHQEEMTRAARDVERASKAVQVAAIFLGVASVALIIVRAVQLLSALGLMP